MRPVTVNLVPVGIVFDGTSVRVIILSANASVDAPEIVAVENKCTQFSSVGLEVCVDDDLGAAGAGVIGALD